MQLTPQSLFRTLMLSAIVVALLPGAADARLTGAEQRGGRLAVRVTGLPTGQIPVAVLRGPGLKRRVAARRLTLRAARPGRYTLTLGKVTISRGSGAVRRGATATPSAKRVAVRVRPGRRATLAGVYGTIVNPGVVSVAPQRVLSVGGAAGDPSSLVLEGRYAFGRDAILSIASSALLPRGLLSHVRSVTARAGRTTVALRAASVYEVAPAMDFDVPLRIVEPARSSAASCGGVSGVKPIRRINDISFSGGWNTKRVLRRDIKVGVRAMVHFNVEAGVEVTGGIGVECSMRASVSANGMAGPIPVTAGIEGELTAFAGVGGKLSSGGSLHVDAGASTIGLPPTILWLPDVRFSNPRFGLSAERFAEARAGIGIGVKAGIGNDSVASATLKLGATAELSARPGSCAWDARFGEFSAGGKLLGWTIESPKTPAFFTRNLWQGACGGVSQPSPGGAPAGPSPGAGPLAPAPEPVPPIDDPQDRVVEVSGSYYHTCAIRGAGDLFCWGHNGGDMGIGQPTPDGPAFTPPTRVVLEQPVRHVALGANHGCAIRADGSVRCWGDNDFGQLGEGTSGGARFEPGPPVNLGPGRTATQIVAGSAHTCALLDDNGVVCWGTWPAQASSPTPTLVDFGASQPVALSSGDSHVCALLNGGQVTCWGAGTYGALGGGDTNDRPAPLAPVDFGGHAATKLAASSPGTSSQCAILDDGSLRCWGWNASGNLGVGDTTMRTGPTPVDIGVGRSVVSVVVGGLHTCALRDDNAVLCWGENGNGEIGLGTDIEDQWQPWRPVIFSGGRHAVTLGTGPSHTCAALDDGSLQCWGVNGDGQLGFETQHVVYTPASAVPFP
jgi:hypothetical protein